MPIEEVYGLMNEDCDSRDAVRINISCLAIRHQGSRLAVMGGRGAEPLDLDYPGHCRREEPGSFAQTPQHTAKDFPVAA